MAAFANGEGGTLLYGVNNDSEVVGINKASDIEERLANLIRTWISPLPEFSIETLPVDTDPNVAVYANADSLTSFPRNQNAEHDNGDSPAAYPPHFHHPISPVH